MSIKASALRLSMAELGRLLGLPKNHSVTDVIYNDADRMKRTVSVVVEGPKMYENFDKCEIPWIGLRELYERIGDPNKITTTLSFENAFTINYKGQKFECKFPLTLAVLSDILAFLANPYGEDVVKKVKVQGDSS